MVLPGVPWNPTEGEIGNALKHCKGVITHTAKYLNVSPKTLYEKIALFPQLKEYIAELRNDYVEETLDESEAAIRRLIQNKDPNVVFKASVFNLNNLGRKRGYNHPRVLEAQANSQLDDIIDG